MCPEIKDIREKLAEVSRQKKEEGQREKDEQLIRSFMTKYQTELISILANVFGSIPEMTEDDMAEAMATLKRKGYNSFLFLEYKGVKKLDHGAVSSRKFLLVTSSISNKELKKQKVPSSAYMRSSEFDDIEGYEERYSEAFIKYGMEEWKVLFDPKAMPIFVEIGEEGEWFKGVQVKLEEMYGEGISKVYSLEGIETIQRGVVQHTGCLT